VHEFALLSTLQLGDSLFPSGAFTQSHGLETLVADGEVCDAAGLRALLRVHLRHRLATADLPALLAAHAAAAAADVALVTDVDHCLTAVKLAREEREASRRVGRRIAQEGLRLAPGAVLREFVRGVEEGRCDGNAAVALGLATEAMEVAAPAAALLACYTFASGLVSAALRLMRLGHGDGQAILRGCQADMANAVRLAATVDWRAMRPFAPHLDVAAARHERAPARLFAS
jgi:urease accessory protein